MISGEEIATYQKEADRRIAQLATLQAELDRQAAVIRNLRQERTERRAAATAASQSAPIAPQKELVGSRADRVRPQLHDGALPAKVRERLACS